MLLSTYLYFDGNCSEAFDYYKSVFGGEFESRNLLSEMPAGEFPVPENQKDRIMHVSLALGGGFIIQGSDTIQGAGPSLEVGNNFAISIRPDSKEDADRFFNALAKGGKVTTPIADVFWGSYFGMLVDQFGIQWMINFDPNT